MAKNKRARSTNVAGLLLEVVGILALFFFPIGTVIGIILLVVGARMTYSRICSDCGNKVEKTSKLCPTCGVRFGATPHTVAAPDQNFKPVGRVNVPESMKRN